MNNITKVSEITKEDIAEYLRLPEPTNDDFNLIMTLIGVSKTFICSYTGQPEDKLDSFRDFVNVVFVLCQDMWDNRVLYVNRETLSYPVKTILGMHSINLL